MWPSSRLTELLNIEHPIIQAPMAGFTTPEMVAAVSNAGELGSHGCAMISVDRFRSEMHQTIAATNRPVNMNFFVHEPPKNNPEKNQYAVDLIAPLFEEFGLGAVPDIVPNHFPFDDDMLEAVLETRPAVASFPFGMPEQSAVAALKDAGIIVLSSATAVCEAVDLEQRGCDAIIAQGWEAGGHRGTYLSTEEGARIGTMSLVPQIVDAVSVPVIAAGGIADGRGIAASFALGASGVQIGTAFLTCAESATSIAHKMALLTAHDDDTRITKAFSGRLARGLNNRYVELLAEHQENLPDFPLMNTVTGPLRKHSVAIDSPDFVALYSGQSVTLNRELSAELLLKTLIEEAQALIYP